MTLHRPMLLALLLALVPGIAAAQKTTYDFDKTAPFSMFKTYSLEQGTPVGQPLIDQRIVAALENELKAKGFTKNDTNPDVFVLYHVAFDKQQDISAYSTGPTYGAYGYGWAVAGVRPRPTCASARSWLARWRWTWSMRRRNRLRGVASARRRSTPVPNRTSATRTSPARSPRS